MTLLQYFNKKLHKLSHLHNFYNICDITDKRKKTDTCPENIENYVVFSCHTSVAESLLFVTQSFKKWGSHINSHFSL